MDHNTERPFRLSAAVMARQAKSASRVSVTVHPGGLRLMTSHGQLARSWNEALTTGFGNLSSPHVDTVVTLQADTEVRSGWWADIEPLLRRGRCRLLQLGIGDQLVAYVPEAVRRIGLWDERFTGVTYQEADYFLRARLHDPGGACIHDASHARVFTPLDDWQALTSRVLVAGPPGYSRGYPGRLRMQEALRRTRLLFDAKWSRLHKSHPSLQVQAAMWNLSYSAHVHKPCPKAATPQDPLYTPFEDGVTNRVCVYGSEDKREWTTTSRPAWMTGSE